jgi:lysophospholipase L1-like esterase
MLKKVILILFTFMTGHSFAQESNTLLSYTKYLEEALLASSPSDEKITEFDKRSDYWMSHKNDYNNHPEKYKNAMALYHKGQEIYVRDRSIEIDRFEDTIEDYRRFDARNQLPNNPILFVGSSSIVFWETANSFPDLPITNRGFGGASLPEVIHYYDDVIKKHNPSMIIVYSDIDVENGKSPEFSVNAFKELIKKVENDFEDIPILLMSMKPTLIDDILGREVRSNKIITNQKLIEYANSKSNLHYVDITSPMLDQTGKLRADIFIADGMHLNSMGYTLWDPVMRKAIEDVRK